MVASRDAVGRGVGSGSTGANSALVRGTGWLCRSAVADGRTGNG